MQLLFWLLCLAVVAIWLTGWVFLIAERIAQKVRLNKHRRFRAWMRKLCGGLCLCLMAITLTGCCKTGAVRIEVPTCPPMLRDATYRAMQADERRDYRIAVQRCQAVGDKQ